MPDSIPLTLHEISGADAQPFEISGNAPFVFGRFAQSHELGPIVGLDREDTAISRYAGVLRLVDGRVFLKNLSTSQSLMLERPRVVMHEVVLPQATVGLHGRTTVLVRGRRNTHDLVVEAQPATSREALRIDGTQDTTSTMHLSLGEREAIEALASGYIARFPHHVEDPLSYADAAALTGVSARSVAKAVERVQRKFADSGQSFDGPHMLRRMIEHLILTGEIGLA